MSTSVVGVGSVTTTLSADSMLTPGDIHDLGVLGGELMSVLAVSLQSVMPNGVDSRGDWLQVLRPDAPSDGAAICHMVQMKAFGDRADPQLPSVTVGLDRLRLACLVVPIGELAVPVAAFVDPASPQPVLRSLAHLAKEQFVAGKAVRGDRPCSERVAIPVFLGVVRRAVTTLVIGLVATLNTTGAGLCHATYTNIRLVGV